MIIQKKSDIFLQNHGENEAGKLVPDLFLFFRKALFEVNASGLELSIFHNLVNNENRI